MAGPNRARGPARGAGGRRGRLPARSPSRRRHHRLRHPLRRRGDARAAYLEGALPAGRFGQGHGPARRDGGLRRRNRRGRIRICHRGGGADGAGAAVAGGRRPDRHPNRPLCEAHRHRAVKAKRTEMERALKSPAAYRFFLLYGPDESGSHSLVKAAAAGAGPEAERVELTGAELKADPARLADEAASISLFGGARYIVVQPAGDECLAAVEALLQAPAAGNPVLLIAGALKPASKLLKLALAEPAALALASYAPEGQEAE